MQDSKITTDFNSVNLSLGFVLREHEESLSHRYTQKRCSTQCYLKKAEMETIWTSKNWGMSKHYCYTKKVENYEFIKNEWIVKVKTIEQHGKMVTTQDMKSRLKLARQYKFIFKKCYITQIHHIPKDYRKMY